MATFPRLRELRSQLGWEVADIARLFPDGKPSLSSIYRLDTASSIRLIGARKVFNIISAEWHKRGLGSLDATAEIIVSKD